MVNYRIFLVYSGFLFFIEVNPIIPLMESMFHISCLTEQQTVHLKKQVLNKTLPDSRLTSESHDRIMNFSIKREEPFLGRFIPSSHELHLV